MRLREYPGTFRHRKLYGELRALVSSGEISVSAETTIAGADGVATSGVVVGVPHQTSEVAVAAVIAAHDPTTPDAAEAAEQQASVNETTLRDRIDQAVNTLEQAQANWPTLTQAQKDTSLRLNVRVTAALARLHLRKLEST